MEKYIKSLSKLVNGNGTLEDYELLQELISEKFNFESITIEEKLSLVIKEIKEINKQLPSRGWSLAITKLEEARFWLSQD